MHGARPRVRHTKWMKTLARERFDCVGNGRIPRVRQDTGRQLRALVTAASQSAASLRLKEGDSGDNAPANERARRGAAESGLLTDAPRFSAGKTSWSLSSRSGLPHFTATS